MTAQLPNDVEKYSETPVFTQDTVPKKLMHVHDTKSGVWGRLVIIEGALDFIIAGPPSTTQHLDETSIAIIEPQVAHHVELTGPVKFKVEFLKKPN